MKKILPSILLILFLLSSCDPDPGVFNSDSVMYTHLVEVWAESLEPYSCDIAFFGDSRVIGADWVSAYPEKDVVNLGVGGDKVEDLLKRLSLLDALDVKECFVAIGGNNALSNTFDACVFKERYEQLILELRERNIEVFLNTIAPVTDIGSNFNESKVSVFNNRINQANQVIMELASRYNATLIDVAPLMTDSYGKLKSEFTTDGVHFNTDGNNLWFEFVRPYLS